MKTTPRQQTQPSQKKASSAFAGFDLASFWNKTAYAKKTYVEAPVTAARIARVEKCLGYTLPAAYVELMRNQNGGIPSNFNHRTATPTSWSTDHIAIEAIFGIGETKIDSLCGQHGSHFRIDIWGYPAIGVYFCDTPSGHDSIALDYRACGPTGEPSVVHVDQARDFAITPLAPTFEAFIRGLQPSEDFP